MAKRFFVYMMTNKPSGVLYVGVTSDIVHRAHQHRTGAVPGFTKRYNLHCLVWVEEHASAHAAITREKRIKKWNRAWKVRLIENANPGWRDLFTEVAAMGH